MQMAALMYYPSLVNARKMDVKLHHCVEAFAYIYKLYKLSVECLNTVIASTYWKPLVRLLNSQKMLQFK